MPNLMSRAQSMLQRNLQVSAGVASITYTRGVHSVTLVGIAWVGNTLFRLQTQMGGSRIEWSDRDYLIPAESLILNGAVVKPAENDRITEVINGTAETYDVLAPEGEPAWRWSDTSHTIARLHTKRVA